MPTIEMPSRTRNGLRPPVVSTQAAKGMRSSEPESDGMATRKPIGDRRQVQDLVDLVGGRPEQRHGGEADEETQRRADQAIATACLLISHASLATRWPCRLVASRP